MSAIIYKYSNLLNIDLFIIKKRNEHFKAIYECFSLWMQSLKTENIISNKCKVLLQW